MRYQVELNGRMEPVPAEIAHWLWVKLGWEMSAPARVGDSAGLITLLQPASWEAATVKAYPAAPRPFHHPELDAPRVHPEVEMSKSRGHYYPQRTDIDGGPDGWDGA